jgi:acyl carrier protein
MNAIYEQLKKVLTKNFFVNPLTVQPNKKFDKDMGLNSLEFLEIIVNIETYFGINIPDEQIENIRTVGQMATCVERLILVEA